MPPKPNKPTPVQQGPVLSSKSKIKIEIEQQGVNQAQKIQDTET